MAKPVEMPRNGKRVWTRSGKAFQVCRRNVRKQTFRLKSVELGVLLRSTYELIDIEVGVLLLRRPRRKP